MTDNQQKVITLDYKLFRDTPEGELIETSEGKTPLVFLSGVGQMIPDFENNVVNLGAGESFSFPIAAANAYGTRTEEAVIELAMDMFMNEGKLIPEVKIGNTIPMKDQEGRIHPAKVVSVNQDTVTMDMNHPLADQNLHFTGKVLEVRAATEDEISHGHVHGPGGHQH